MTTDIDKLRKLCEGATEGPWRYDHGNWAVEKWAPTRNDHRMDICSLSSLSTRKGKSICGNFEDGEFIAECRTAVPELIELVERQRERIEKLKEALVRAEKVCKLGAKMMSASSPKEGADLCIEFEAAVLEWQKGGE